MIQEIQKEMDAFIDVEGPSILCPDCGYPHCKEIPSLISFHLQKLKPKHSPKRFKLSDIDTPLPHEVRQMLAKELFDPCSCGEHVPEDLEAHEPDCHVHGHSFMKPDESKFPSKSTPQP